MNKKNKASSAKIPKILKEDKFSSFAIEIIRKLKQSGFQGYLVEDVYVTHWLESKLKILMFRQMLPPKKSERFLDHQELLVKGFAWFMSLVKMS